LGDLYGNTGPLTTFNHYNGGYWGPAAMTTVKNNIDLGRPLGVAINWYDPYNSYIGSHVAAIAGYQCQGSAAGLLHVYDPYFGPSCYDYDTMLHDYMAQSTSYSQYGTWAFTYFTI
jgi:hypothetical protein